MEDFVFRGHTAVIFGRGKEAEAGREIKAQGAKKALFLYGQGSIKKSGLHRTVVSALEKEGIGFVELSGVMPNPRLSFVRRGISFCRENKVDFILAVGGGSVIDCAKAIAVGVPYEGDVWDFSSKKIPPKKALPIGVILTIPAAGSETSQYSVITNDEGAYPLKRDAVYANYEIIRPVFAILDPELTLDLPPFQTACGIVDIMSHVIERYFTIVKNVDFTDRLCEATMKTIIENGRIVMKEPRNYDARAEIMWAGSVAHNDLLSTGRCRGLVLPCRRARAERGLRHDPRGGPGHRPSGLGRMSISMPSRVSCSSPSGLECRAGLRRAGAHGAGRYFPHGAVFPKPRSADETVGGEDRLREIPRDGREKRKEGQHQKTGRPGRAKDPGTRAHLILKGKGLINEVVYEGNLSRVTKLYDDLYFRSGNLEVRDQCNCGIIILGNCTALVDYTGQDPDEEIIEEAKKITENVSAISS